MLEQLIHVLKQYSPMVNCENEISSYHSKKKKIKRFSIEYIQFFKSQPLFLNGKILLITHYLLSLLQSYL
jgi:hypothetical protein